MTPQSGPQDVNLGVEVEHAFGWLAAEHGFKVRTPPTVTESWSQVMLESSSVVLRVSFDAARGEVDVNAYPLAGRSKDVRMWSYTGIVGRASLARVLELASGQLRAVPAAIAGDPAFYAELRQQTDLAAREYNRRAQGLPRETSFRPKLP